VRAGLTPRRIERGQPRSPDPGRNGPNGKRGAEPHTWASCIVTWGVKTQLGHNSPFWSGRPSQPLPKRYEPGVRQSPDASSTPAVLIVALAIVGAAALAAGAVYLIGHRVINASTARPHLHTAQVGGSSPLAPTRSGRERGACAPRRPRNAAHPEPGAERARRAGRPAPTGRAGGAARGGRRYESATERILFVSRPLFRGHRGAKRPAVIETDGGVGLLWVRE
jgi:hypothetical protein